MAWEAIVAVLAVLGGVAALVIVLKIDPSIVVTLGLMLGIFSGNWDHLGLPIGVDRLLILVGAFLALVEWHRRGWDGFELNAPVVLMIVLGGYAVVSAVWSDQLTEKRSLYALLDQLGLLPFALFALAPVLYGQARQRRILLGGLVVLGLYLGLIASFETVHAYSLVFPKYINDPSIGIHFDRARGPFTEASANGGALFVCAVACAMAIASWRSTPLRVAAGGILALCLLGIVGTVTREVWLAAALATLVSLLAFAPLRRYFVPVTLVAVLGVGLALAAVPGLADRAQQRSATKNSVWDRLNSNRAATNMIGAKPVLGFGWGTFAARSPTYYSQAATYPVSGVSQLHNVALSITTELGIFGFVLWACALLIPAVTALRMRAPPGLELWRMGLLPILVSFLVLCNFTPLTYPFANYVVWVWLGIVYAGQRRAAPAVAPRPRVAVAASA